MTPASESVLVTGASGFVGRHALAPLVDAGLEVHAVSRRPQPDRAGVTWHRADLLDGESAMALCAALRPSHLLHFAWVVDHGAFWDSPANFDWLAQSVLLFRAFSEAGGRRAVGVGSCVEYAASDGPMPETGTPLAPDTLYGRAKHACRQALAASADDHGFSAAWGRMFLPYGEDEPPGKLVPSLIRRLLAGEPAPLTSGTQRRDFIDSRDAGAAFAALLLSGVEGAVNVATGRPVSVADVAAALGELSGRPELVQSGALPDRPGDPPALLADVGRLTGEVGFRPRHELHAGLAHALDWWRRRLAERNR